ncbi:hypothetical protein [Aneurinibacillus tyrosinisolvens]|uniref:hypothetical protein n=1 Tax=Aneurinibacillus tyrosinisolvens TaxID=1443435 RepID=UPI00063F2B80|nr:hypothetical protein [Aneurinibacillus tyrosinisolvens]
MNVLELKAKDRLLKFNYVPISFNGIIEKDVFSKKNNKTVAETIRHQRYLNLKELTETKYGGYLKMPIGEFLYYLKGNNDIFYKSFLNKYGDLEYTQFHIDDKQSLNLKGIYLYSSNGTIKYIGRCLDHFGKRINQGYGKIHPKNCFRDGQATNCHLNALITNHIKEELSFYVLPLKDDDDIKALEIELIRNYKPEWNVQMKG